MGACSALIQSTLRPGPCTDNVIKVLGERVHEVEGMRFSEQIDVFRVMLMAVTLWSSISFTSVGYQDLGGAWKTGKACELALCVGTIIIIIRVIVHV